MSKTFIWAGSILAFALFTVSGQAAPSQPNIIFILADDLGFGDIGPTFQN